MHGPAGGTRGSGNAAGAVGEGKAVTARSDAKPRAESSNTRVGGLSPRLAVHARGKQRADSVTVGCAMKGSNREVPAPRGLRPRGSRARNRETRTIGGGLGRTSILPFFHEGRADSSRAMLPCTPHIKHRDTSTSLVSTVTRSRITETNTLATRQGFLPITTNSTAIRTGAELESYVNKRAP